MMRYWISCWRISEKMRGLCISKNTTTLRLDCILQVTGDWRKNGLNKLENMR
jgi:hypothetical protein